MGKSEQKRLAIFIVAIVIGVFVVNIDLGLFLQSRKQEKERRIPVITSAPTPTSVVSDTFFYTGQAGKDALSLLKEQTMVEQDKSGLVISINGRKADSAKREYWAFYVNEGLAPVGPAEYKTKEEDKLGWKIEQY